MMTTEAFRIQDLEIRMGQLVLNHLKDRVGRGEPITEGDGLTVDREMEEVLDDWIRLGRLRAAAQLGLRRR